MYSNFFFNWYAPLSCPHYLRLYFSWHCPIMFLLLKNSNCWNRIDNVRIGNDRKCFQVHVCGFGWNIRKVETDQGKIETGTIWELDTESIKADFYVLFETNGQASTKWMTITTSCFEFVLSSVEPQINTEHRLCLPMQLWTSTNKK